MTPENVVFHYNRALSLYILNLFSESIKELSKCIALKGDFTSGYLLKAMCYIRLQDFHTASKVYQNVQKLDCEDSRFSDFERIPMEYSRSVIYINQLMRNNQNEEALKEVNQALLFSNHCTLFMRMKATVLLLLKRAHESKFFADSTTKILSSLNADELNFRGFCLYYFGEVEKAVVYFQYASFLMPNSRYFSHFNNRAISFCVFKENGKQALISSNMSVALQNYTSALNIDYSNKWENAKIHFNRSIVYGKMNQSKEAIEDCSIAIRLNKKYLKAYARRAKLLLESKLYVKALRDFKIVCNLDDKTVNKEMFEEAKRNLVKSSMKYKRSQQVQSQFIRI
ncbi:dnaJ subfamily C member 7-like isoform X2, partial [Leptotrombidium deliense]